MRDHRKAEYLEPTERHMRLAKQLVDGKPIMTAMIEQGYSPKFARQGIKALPKTVIKLMPKLAKSNLMDLGRCTPEDQETVARGRLMYGAITGSDKGVLAAKQLGADKRVAMWQTEIQTGIVVITPPAPVEDKTKLLESEE